MTGNGRNPFSATDSVTGYLYQVRIGLLHSLRRLKSGGAFSVSLETLDDVVFETKGGSSAELLQTKHHQSREASLTDGSSDLWSTIRVWLAAKHESGEISHYYLLTTAQAAPASIASFLKVGTDRNVDAALAAMASTAASSTNKSNEKAYKAFNQATLSRRREIAERIFVLDGAPSIGEVEAELQAELFWAVSREHQDAFLERLEGWWLRRVLKELTSGKKGFILGDEIEAEISDLQGQFGPDALPIDEDLLAFDLDESTRLAHSESTFVRQLQIIDAGKNRIAAAVRDYYRAFEQRSRWVRNDLLLVGDLDQYERHLVEEWELAFAAIHDELGPAASEQAKRTAAREVLRWAEVFSAPIRPKVTEPFVARGSLHMLSDDLRIGWHPEFRELLAAVLVGRGAGE